MLGENDALFDGCDTCKHEVCDDCSSAHWKPEDENTPIVLDSISGAPLSKGRWMPPAHRWHKCAGCGPEDRGRVCYVEHHRLTRPCTITNVETERSWLHCRGCLRTYYGAEEQPEVCVRCHDELTSGDSVWVKESPWGNDGRVVRR